MLFFSLLGVLPVLGQIVAYDPDYPPHADAGPDITLHLPKTSVTLNGSASSDDHYLLQYQWTITDGLSADMMGVSTAILRLSNLQLGDYTFKLTVIDSVGQFSTDIVHVSVQSAVCDDRNINTLSESRGTIDSSHYRSVPCMEWYINGPSSSDIIIRFTDLKLDNIDNSYGCGSRTHIELGPLPLKLICGSLEDNAVYTSQRNHMWIKLVSGADTYSPTGSFKLKFLAIPESCQDDDFLCDNGRCIYQDWKCNGYSECGDWSDEKNCEPLTSPKLTLTTVAPKPWYNSLVTYRSAYRSSINCSTVYCYVPSYAMHICIASWEMCDGIKQCLYNDDEKNCGEAETTKKITTRSPAFYAERPTYRLSTTSSSCSTVYCYVPIFDRTMCLERQYMCDGTKHCYYGDDENVETCQKAETTKKITTGSPAFYTERPTYRLNTSSSSCSTVYCYVPIFHRTMCLERQYMCDGMKHCYNGDDENVETCKRELSCGRRLESYTGWFASPNFPSNYPSKAHCSWEIHVIGETESQIQLRFIAFYLQRDKNTDYVEVYDGADKSFPLLGRFDGSDTPPEVITSSRSWMLVKFVSDGYFSFMGFNATYQMKGYCLPNQKPCRMASDCYDESCNDCYDINKQCDGHWDCSNGVDEADCHFCGMGQFSCGGGTGQCYESSDRCNGNKKCSSNADEEDCDPIRCGPHNGTFLCENKRCIYESWTCDQRDDCGDFSDEQHCFGSSKRVIIAAISGSVICALLLTILIGCSCKLYSLRTIERHGGIRHHSPMSRLYAEFLRRTAPPPYHEAMLTSRNYDEVQQERRERLRQQNRAARHGSGQGNNSSAAGEGNENAENQAESDNTTERDNLIVVNEVAVSEANGNDNPNFVPDMTDSTVVTVDRSTEVTEDQNSDCESDSGSSVDQDENDIDCDNVVPQDGIEMQAAGLSSRGENIDEHDESSDESCILNHPSDGDENSQNLDNQSISLDDISMETASASINLELSEILEETNVDIENREQGDSDKGIGSEEENNMENRWRSLDPNDDNNEVITVGPSGRRNSQESHTSLHSSDTADSDEPLLVA